jgi:biopolymer transport protein ExbB/TolQ
MMGGGNLLGMLVSWLPILILILVWLGIYFKSRNAYMGRSGKTHGEMLEEHVAELRRQNDLLEKIVKDQEARLQKLESRRQTGSAGGTGGGGAGGGGR